MRPCPLSVEPMQAKLVLSYGMNLPVTEVSISERNRRSHTTELTDLTSTDWINELSLQKIHYIR